MLAPFLFSIRTKRITKALGKVIDKAQSLTVTNPKGDSFYQLELKFSDPQDSTKLYEEMISNGLQRIKLVEIEDYLLFSEYNGEEEVVTITLSINERTVLGFLSKFLK